MYPIYLNYINFFYTLSFFNLLSPALIVYAGEFLLYQLALETYTKVQSIKLESSTDLDITSAELHNLMANSPELQQNNYILEESFMLKFSKAMTFAKLKSS